MYKWTQPCKEIFCWKKSHFKTILANEQAHSKLIVKIMFTDIFRSVFFILNETSSTIHTFSGITIKNLIYFKRQIG